MKKLKRMAMLSKGRCLDIGFAHNPNPFLTDVVGVDIQNAKKPENYKEIFHLDLNIQPLPFPDASFDTVLAGDVIEHLENPSQFLREINRVLRENGKLILSTPHATCWWTFLHNSFLRSFVNDPDIGEHLSNWTILDMQRLLKLNGFKIVKLWGTECEIPKIKLKIPVTHFPTLGWIIIYEVQKRELPVRFIYLNKNKEIVRHVKHYTFKEQEKSSS